MEDVEEDVGQASYPVQLDQILEDIYILQTRHTKIGINWLDSYKIVTKKVKLIFLQ